jgi:hypothetical protein
MVIHEFSSSRIGPLVAAGSFRKTVAIWNAETAQKLAELNTVLGGGGHRLLLSSDGACCLAADYSRLGVACYHSVDGREVWHRRDLRKVQRLSLTRDGCAIYCEGEKRFTHQLDLQSGETRSTLQGVKEITESPWAPIVFCERVAYRSEGKFSLLTDDGLQVAQIHASTDDGVILHAAFSPKELCISEMNGPVRFFNAESGEELRRYAPTPGCHVLKVEYSDSNGKFFGVEYDCYKHVPMKLLRFEEGGEATVIREIAQGACAFCMARDYLITVDGEVVDLKDGRTVRRLNFQENADEEKWQSKS